MIVNCPRCGNCMKQKANKNGYLVFKCEPGEASEGSECQKKGDGYWVSGTEEQISKILNGKASRSV